MDGRPRCGGGQPAAVAAPLCAAAAEESPSNGQPLTTMIIAVRNFLRLYFTQNSTRSKKASLPQQARSFDAEWVYNRRPRRRRNQMTNPPKPSNATNDGSGTASTWNELKNASA